MGNRKSKSGAGTLPPREYPADHQWKLVAVGDRAVGKTSALVTFATKSFPNDYLPTLYDSYTIEEEFGAEKYSILLDDTPSHQEYVYIRRSSYQRADLIVLCFSISSPSSFNNIKATWVPEFLLGAPDIKFLLLGTKSDLRPDSDIIAKLKSEGTDFISTSDGQALSEEIGAIGYMECSAKESLESVNSVLEQVARFFHAAKHGEEYRIPLPHSSAKSARN